MNAGTRPEELRSFAAEVGRVADDDRACLEAFLGRLDSAPSQTRRGAVWLAEKLGRLKLNGRVLRSSPLSAVTELEGCRLLLESNRALWAGVGYLGPADATDRVLRTERLLETAESLRLDALDRATQGTPASS
jgi:hypothetical protein